jgi:hypothetical protein
VLSFFFLKEPTLAIKNRSDANAWQQQHDPLAPKTGDVAPDFSLSDINGENALSLSGFRSDKPVALVFGSFT